MKQHHTISPRCGSINTASDLKQGMYLSKNKAAPYCTAPMWHGVVQLPLDITVNVCAQGTCVVDPRYTCTPPRQQELQKLSTLKTYKPMLTLMDQQLSDQAIQCMSMFAVYALGCWHCRQYRTKVIRCNAASFALENIPSFKPGIR